MTQTAFQAALPAAPEAVPADQCGCHSARYVLVVDDEIEIAAFVAEALRDEGYSVRVLHDGASALVEIMQRPPTLVVLDVAMPVMVGDDVLRFLRHNGYDELPVIMMTAGLNPDKHRGSGATEVLAKPFDIELLLQTVDRYADATPNTQP